MFIESVGSKNTNENEQEVTQPSNTAYQERRREIKTGTEVKLYT